jgi:hypothetical protein
MAENNNRGDGSGYSDTLGGYGVPSQLKVTGESPAPAPPRRTRTPGKQKKNRLVFRPKPKHIVLLSAIAAAVVVAILFATGVFNQYANSVDISKVTQESSGVTSTNYMAVLAADVDWAGLSDDERRGIAKYAVKKALELAEADQANIFIVIGQTNDRNTPVFYYAPDGAVPYKLNAPIQIMVNGQGELLEP